MHNSTFDYSAEKCSLVLYLAPQTLIQLFIFQLACVELYLLMHGILTSQRGFSQTHSFWQGIQMVNSLLYTFFRNSIQKLQKYTKSRQKLVNHLYTFTKMSVHIRI